MLIWLSSYPRSGNTFVRSLLRECFNISTASIYGKNERVAQIVDAEKWSGEWKTIKNLMENDNKIHIVKTHEKPNLNDTNKTIYIIRDGRAAISSYQIFSNELGKKNHSLIDIINGNCKHGSWSEHYNSWDPLKRQNTLLIKYEDLLSNIENEIDKISIFLNIKAIKKWNRSFKDFQSLMPNFFKEGNNDNHLKRYTSEELKLFYDLHDEVFKKNYNKDESGD